MANPYKTEIALLKETTKQHTRNIRYLKDRCRQLISQARQPDCAGKQALRDEADSCRNEALAIRLNARHALLAYGIIRGLPYQRIENAAKKRPDVGSIQSFLPNIEMNIPRRVIETWLSGGCMSLLECLEAHGPLDTSEAA